MKFGVRELIFLLLLIGVPVAAYFYVYEPRNIQIEEAREEIKVKTDKLKRLDEAMSSILDLGHEIDKLSESIALYEQKLPTQREVEVILKEVWELAAKHELTPKSIRTDKIVSTAHYAELPIKMEIIGNFDGLYSFLLDLERLQRITRMPTMKLKKMSCSQEGNMQADVILSIFFEG